MATAAVEWGWFRLILEVFCVSTFRKMCVCITKSCACGSGFAKRSSWQGAPAARSPLHPLRPNGASQSPIQPDNGSDRIGAFQCHRGDFGSPRQAYGRMPSPSTRGVPDPFEPSRLQRGEGAFHSSPRPHRPFHGDQPSADWIPPCLSHAGMATAMDTDLSVFHRPRP